MTDSQTTFINPYTFVPLPAVDPDRRVPTGHSGTNSGPLLSGKLSVEIRARGPVLIKGYRSSDGHGGTTHVLPRRADGQAFLPGSSLKGALRSLHETLTGSCLRAFDPDYLPSYRETVVHRPNRRMAVVEEPPGENTPPKIRLCEAAQADRYRLRQDVFKANKPCSGQRLRIEWRDPAQPVVKFDSEGDWILFVSDAGPRKPTQPYYAHVRKISQEPAAVTEIPEKVWDDFCRVVQDADDQRTSRLSDTRGKRYHEVKHQYRPKKGPPRTFVGYRYLASRDLEKGQPVWVDIENGGVTWLGLAMNWRRLGAGTAGERAGEFHPCRDYVELCPSCRLLGSVDPIEAKGDKTAVQRAYRGHVRFHDAVAGHIADGEPWHLPPMGAPSPGAGQAYLKNSPEDIGDWAATPLRQWGAQPDAVEARPLRGRKFYWPTPEFNGREQAREHQKRSAGNSERELTSKASAFPAGTTFTTEITFTDLTEAQLGGLLATLEPWRVLLDGGAADDEELNVLIGGGKPLGFGRCALAVNTADSVVHRSAERYSGHERLPLETGVDRLIKAFVESVDDLVRELWEPLKRVLSPAGCDGSLVWYPPGAHWDKRGENKGKTFDDGYTQFWKQHSGGATKPDDPNSNGFPLGVLPDATDDEQRVQIVSKARWEKRS